MEQEPHAHLTEGADHQRHEQQLAAALRDLLQQVDLADYKDGQGQSARDSAAFRKAQEIVQAFGLTHEQLCSTLDECDAAGDLHEAARKLAADRVADPSWTPPEYNTWHTGP